MDERSNTATLDETNWEQEYDDAVAAGEGEPPDLYVGTDVDANKRIPMLVISRIARGATMTG